MPSTLYRLLAGLALAGLAGSALAQMPIRGYPVDSDLMAQATSAAPVAGVPAATHTDQTLTRAAVEDIVRRTLAACPSTTCCPMPTCYHCEGAVEVPILRPYFDGFSNDGAFVNQEIGDSFVQTNREAQYDLEPSIRYWLSYVGGNGFGGRVRYWHFQADSDPLFLQGVDDDGDSRSTFIATSLEMHVLDFEALCRRHYALWVVEAALGVRYARVERDEGFERISSFTVFDSENRGTDDSRFEGVGPTVALEGRRRIVNGLSGFVNGRASLLAGQTEFDTFTVSIFDGDTQTSISHRETDNSLFVVETQIGLEYARPLGSVELVGRAALEVQYWFDAGSVFADGFSSDHDDLGLAGFVLVGGFRR